MHMNTMQRLDRLANGVRRNERPIVYTLIVLLMINYMFVTIMLRDLFLLKMLRDILLVLLLLGAFWKRKIRLGLTALLAGVFCVLCLPAAAFSTKLSLGITMLRRYFFPLLLFFAVYYTQPTKEPGKFYGFAAWLFAGLSLLGIFQAHVLGDEFLMNLGYPTQYAPHYGREMLYNSYYFGGFGIQRVVMTLSNSNVCALVLGSTLIFLLCGLSNFKNKARTYVLLGIIAVAYVLTFSRSNFLAMVLVVALIGWPYVPHKKKILIALGCAAVLVVIVGLLQGEDGLLYKLLLWVRDSFTMKESSAAGRSGRWMAALSTALRNPFGIGFGHVGSVASEAGITEEYYSCENSFLAVALDTGWLGVLLYYGFVALLAVRLMRYVKLFRKAGDRANEMACLSGFVIIIYFLVVFFFSNHVYDLEAMALIYVYIAILLKNARVAQKIAKGTQDAEKDMQ